MQIVEKINQRNRIEISGAPHALKGAKQCIDRKIAESSR